MALNVSAWSIRQPLPSIVMVAALVAIGYVSFTKMPITRMPNIDVPVIAVLITQFGASPADLERANPSLVGGDSLAGPLATTSSPRFRTELQTPPSYSGWKPTPIARSTMSRTRSRASALICRAPSTSPWSSGSTSPGSRFSPMPRSHPEKPPKSSRGSSRIRSYAHCRGSAGLRAWTASGTSSARSASGSIRFGCRASA